METTVTSVVLPGSHFQPFKKSSWRRGRADLGQWQEVRRLDKGHSHCRGRTEISTPESAAFSRSWETQGDADTLVGINLQAMRSSFTAPRSKSKAHRTDTLDLLTQEQTQVWDPGVPAVTVRAAPAS